MDRKFYVTTPIYYVNAEPHIGHGYTTIVADFLKRFYKMRGFDSYFLTGTDEHGDKIQKVAHENGSSPADFAERISAKFKAAWKEIGIEYDDFIRTSEARHGKVVQEILQKVYDNGDIYFGSYGGHYCVGCERYLSETDLVDGKCPDHKKEPEYIEEKNYFFKMKKYQGWLLDHIEKNPDFIRPERYKNEVVALLKNEELEDLCISRPVSRLKWGIPLPFDKDYVAYVWFDALINYISAIGYPDGEKFKKYWPVSNHLIAKDILKQHGIFWPTMLKAMGAEPYFHLNVHGYWNMADAKMSKSLGNVITPQYLVGRYGNDQIRYFLLREMTFGLDAKFTEDAIIDRINYDLANDLGNLINRTINMTEKYFGGKVPARGSDVAGLAEIKDFLFRAAGEYFAQVEKCQISFGIEKLWEFVRYLNKYVDEKKPWVLDKEGKKEELGFVLRNLLESIISIAYLVSPICLTISPRVISSFKLTRNLDIDNIFTLDNLEVDGAILNPGILFPKMEKEKPAASEKKAEGKEIKEKKAVEEIQEADFTDFQKLDLRVAKILSAEKVEGSDKLLRLQIDSGINKRQIVAGIAQKYSPEEVNGKKIIIVANLKPAMIFKNKSEGMLLAAKKEKADLPTVIFVDDSIETGSKLS